MSSSSDLCVDSSVVVRSVLPDCAPPLKELWRGWLRDRVMLHAPALLRYELVNALHQQRRVGYLTDLEARAALHDALERPIVLHEDVKLHTRAFELAAELRLSAAYDAQFLALAEQLGVELWTADAKLAKSVEGELPWVRLVP